MKISFRHNLLITQPFFFFFLDGRQESFQACIGTLQRFASMSGLNMNHDKTMVVWIGSPKHSRVKFMPELNLNWNPVTFKVLGVIFSTNVYEIVLISYEMEKTTKQKTTTPVEQLVKKKHNPIW